MRAAADILAALEKALDILDRVGCAALAAELDVAIRTAEPGAALHLWPRIETCSARAEELLRRLRSELQVAGSGRRAVESYQRR